MVEAPAQPSADGQVVTRTSSDARSEQLHELPLVTSVTRRDSDSRCRCRASSGLRDLPFALLDEREQVAVDEVGMRTGESMRQAGIVDFGSPLDQLC